MNSSNPLDSVYFVNFPEHFSLSKDAFQIDTSIPLPVQKKDGQEEEIFDPSQLTEEQIFSGILTVLAHDRSNPNLDYYRSVINSARPSIKKELQEAAILKTRDEDWEFAEEIWWALHGLDPENKAIILNMALFYDQKADSYRRNNLTEDADAFDDIALQYYKEAMDADPEIPDAFFNVGYFYLKKRNFADARGAFESFLALCADTPDDEMGENGIQKKHEAQDQITKIKTRNLENEHFHNAYDYISRGEEEKGIEEIRRFLQENPAVWNAWFMLGWGLRRLGRFADAKMAFEKARECEGGDENADTLNELAICQMETGELSEAKNTLVEALEMDPDSTKIISNLGFLSLKSGNEAEARQYFLTVLEIDPEDPIAKAELKELSKEV
ncbi:MAG: tetratricopeptide repeat protein [Treponema sp.]|nr:tetratricopeptide repeat protein [Treponema sp.]